VPPEDAGCLIAAAISSPDQMHLRVIDVIPSRRESAISDGAHREMRY
jgi:hypothetical protein